MQMSGSWQATWPTNLSYVAWLGRQRFPLLLLLLLLFVCLSAPLRFRMSTVATGSLSAMWQHLT
jgi:hypothetical protein